MSEAIRKTEQANPESYSPKKPELASMMKEAQTKNAEESEEDSRMLKFDRFEVVKCEPYKFMGKSIYMGNKGDFGLFKGVSDLVWKQREGVFKALDELLEYASDIPHEAVLWSWDKYCERTDLFGNTYGRFMKPETPVEPSMDYLDIPAEYLAKGYVRMDNKEMIKKGSRLIPLEILMEEEIGRQNEYTGAGIFVNAIVYTEPDENGVSWMGIYFPVRPRTNEEKAEWEAEHKLAEESERMRGVFIAKMNALPSNGESVNVDLSSMVKKGDFNLSYTGGSMEMTIKDGESCVLTPQRFNLPLKIQFRAKQDGGGCGGIQIGYGQGMVIFRHDISALYIHDIANGQSNGDLNGYGEIPKNKFIDFEWIIDREFMAVKVNGELRHIGNNFQYVREFKKNSNYNPSAAVNVAAKWGSTVTVESLRISAIGDHPLCTAEAGVVSFGGLWNPDRAASTLDGYSQITKTDWASLGEFELFNCLAQNIIVELDDVYSVTGFTFADSHSQICNPDYLSGEEVVLYSIYVTSDINDWGNAVKNVNCAAQKNRAGETVNFGAKAGKYVILDFTASPGNAAFIAVADPFSVNVMP